MMSRELRLLIVEDSDDDARLVLRTVEQAGWEVTWERVDTRDGLRATLRDRTWDIVLSDYSMPSLIGTEALALVRDVDADLPFIFVSGTIGEETAVEAMRCGAADYVMKHNLSRLPPAIERELREASTRRERRKAQDRLRYLALHDELTGLPNRVLFVNRLEQTAREADRRGRSIGVLIVDLDRFSIINDTLGHGQGDRLLKAVGVRLTTNLPSAYTVARLSNDLFAILLTDLEGSAAAARIGGEVLRHLSEPFRAEDREIRIGASIGVSLYPADSRDVEALLRNANIAGQQAKRDGRNTLRFFTEELRMDAANTVALEHALRRAVTNQEFDVHYQPIVDTRTGRIVQLEALLRWSVPNHGPVSPSDFIPLAEATGLIDELGSWTLRTACRQAVHWQAEGLDPISIAVNVSPLQVRRGDLPGVVREALAESGLPASRLAIELTESVVMDPEGPAGRVLQELRDLGVTISLDDFGTGYSSLSRLKHLPLDRIKIDRSFISQVPEDPGDTAIARAIIAMARHLKLDTVAEGVTNARQVDFLVREGCDFMQGYLFGRALPASDVSVLLQEGATVAPAHI